MLQMEAKLPTIPLTQVNTNNNSLDNIVTQFLRDQRKSKYQSKQSLILDIKSLLSFDMFV